MARAGRGTILLLAAIAALGSLATQLVVPALPQIAADLRADPGDAQLVISLFLIGLGLGQVIAGPLADRVGRKAMLLTGLALYCAAGALASLTQALPLLLAARLVQALGGAAGLVCARVLVSDLFPAEEAPARQASLMAVVLVSPALGPVLGGMVSEALGWRALFALLAVAGLGGMALVTATLQGDRRKRPVEPRPRLWQSLRLLAGNRAFVLSALALAAGSSALYMFLGQAPFLLAHDHGLSADAIGLCLMATAASSIAGTFLVRRLDRRGHAVVAGTALLVGGSLLMIAAPLAGLPGVGAFVVPTMVVGLGAGICGPAGIARVIRAQPGLEGTATSIAGAVQMLLSAAAAGLLGLAAPLGASGLGTALLLAAAIALTAALANHRGGRDAMQGLA